MHSTTCPICHNSIGFFSILWAGWPTRIHCPKCGINLAFEGYPKKLIISCLICYLIILGFWIQYYIDQIPIGLEGCLLVGFVAIAGWLPMEWLFSKQLLRENHLKPH